MQIRGTTYCEGSVVTLTSSILPTFRRIIDILIADVDTPLLVCEILQTEEFRAHLHAFVVRTQEPIPTTVLKQNEVADHHVLGLYKLSLFQDDIFSLYIVPKYHVVDA